MSAFLWLAVVRGLMKLSPGTLTVLRGDEARFTCSTSDTQWTVMLWLLNGTAVLTISKEFGVLPSINPNVTAETSLVSRGDSWVFVLKSTERHNQGPVTCDLQGIDRTTASLFVQGMHVCVCVCVCEIVWQEGSRQLFFSAAENLKVFFYAASSGTLQSFLSFFP